MRPLLAFGSLLFSCSILAAAEEANTPAPPFNAAIRAMELVRELADPRFRIRDAAAKELTKLGRLAKPALLEGAKSPDPEVWNRCAQLLPEVMALDLKARVDAFLADAEGKQQHDLPLMACYKKLVGNGAPARKLYAEMVKANANFMEACELNPKLAGEKYAMRAQELQQHLWGPRFGGTVPGRINTNDIAVLFLIGADPEMGKGIKNNNINPLANLLWQQDFQNALRNGEQAPPFRKLFFAWAENRNDVNSISQVLSVIQNSNMTDGLEFAVKVMKMKDLQIWTRAQAMTCVGKMGSKEHIPAFEAIFDDKTQVTNIQLNNNNVNVQISTQINDIALAMAVNLSKQNPKDYGFDALQTNAALLWAYHYLGFSTPEKRAAAFKKYADWSAAEKKKKK